MQPDNPALLPPDTGHALRGNCPACGQEPLFEGLLALAAECSSCGLDYGRFNVGDGPAAFAILIVGAVFCGLTLWFEFRFYPPWWAHALLWPPLLTIATVACLRLIKAALIGSEFANQAREGERSEEP